MPHPVVHFEIGCRDSAKTQEFYKKLFDWKIETMGPAAMIATEAGGITGHITALGHEPQHYTIFYVGVDDVAAYLEKAKSLGAKTLVGPIDIPRALSPGCRIPKVTRSACGRTSPSKRREKRPDSGRSTDFSLCNFAERAYLLDGWFAAGLISESCWTPVRRRAYRIPQPIAPAAMAQIRVANIVSMIVACAG